MFGLSLAGRTGSSGGGASGALSLGLQAVIPTGSRSLVTPQGTSASSINLNGQLQLQQQQQQQVQRSTTSYAIPTQPLQSYTGIGAGAIYTGSGLPPGVPSAQKASVPAATQGSTYQGWGYTPQQQLQSQQQYSGHGLQLTGGAMSGSTPRHQRRHSRRWLQQVQDTLQSIVDAPALADAGHWAEAVGAAYL